MKSCKCQDCETEYLYSNRVLKACLRCGSKKIENGDKNYNIPDEKLGKSVYDKKDFLSEINDLLREGGFTPDDIVEKTEIVECIKLYIPYYLYQISYKCTFTCSVGYNKKDDIDWKPFQAKIDGQKKIYYIASNKFYEIKKFINKVSQCDKAYADNSNIQEDIVIEKLELSKEKVFKTRCESKLGNYIDSKIDEAIPGNHTKHLKINSSDYSIDSGDLNFKVIWVALCNYKGSLFSILSDANDSGVYQVIDKPVDQEKKNLAEKIEQDKKDLAEKIEQDKKNLAQKKKNLEDKIIQDMKNAVGGIDEDNKKTIDKIDGRLDKLGILFGISITAIILSFILVFITRGEGHIVMSFIWAILILFGIPCSIISSIRKLILKKKRNVIMKKYEEKRNSIINETKEKLESI
jgi:hypothetical protein